MPKEGPKVMDRLDDSDYGTFESVIDITMGEFAFSDQLPIHSDSYGTCLGVVVGAVDVAGVCLAHLDPIADDDTGTLYRSSLDAMMRRVRAVGSAEVDVVLFSDFSYAVTKYQLKDYLSGRLDPKVRSILDLTVSEGHFYDEAVVMPSPLHSVYACLKPLAADAWNWRTNKRVYQTDDAAFANLVARSLGRAREVSLEDGGGGLMKLGSERSHVP
jgi:hypothetical protein